MRLWEIHTCWSSELTAVRRKRERKKTRSHLMWKGVKQLFFFIEISLVKKEKREIAPKSTTNFISFIVASSRLPQVHQLPEVVIAQCLISSWYKHWADITSNQGKCSIVGSISNYCAIAIGLARAKIGRSFLPDWSLRHGGNPYFGQSVLTS